MKNEEAIATLEGLLGNEYFTISEEKAIEYALSVLKRLRHGKEIKQATTTLDPTKATTT